MRAPSPTDFDVVHPVLGTFVYGRRTYGDRIKIRLKYLAMLQVNDDTGLDTSLVAMCAIVSGHSVLCVSAPEGWEDLEKVDLITEPGNEALLLELYALLKRREDDFRRKPATPSKS